MEEFQYLLPEESSEMMINNVAKLREIENNLRNIFTQYHYQEVMLPSFEYVDLYSNMDIGIDQERMFQFINQEGKRIALRADFTLPLARLYVTTSQEEVARYSYFGKVYRQEKKHKGRSNEFYQGGVELIGLEGLKGELECLDMIEKSRDYLGLKQIKLVLGSAKFYHRLIELVGDELIVEIIDLRSFSMMKELIERNHIQGSLKALLLSLPKALGDYHLLERMIDIVEDDILKEALLELKELYARLHYKDIDFDLCMVPSMKYYTGMMLKGYSPYCSKAIISGGRYDHLMRRFNKDVPAIGFSYDFHHIMHALEMEEDHHD